MHTRALRVLLALAGSALALGGCDQGGEGSPSLRGRSTAAYARVCADLDGDLVCEEQEPSAQTRADGSFALPWSHSGADVPVVVEVQGGVSRSVFDQTVYSRSFPLVFSGTGPAVVSVFSTLAHATVASGVNDPGSAPDAVASAFGIPSSEVVFSGAPSAESGAYAKVLEASYAPAYARTRESGASTAGAASAAAGHVYGRAPEFATFFDRVDRSWLTTGAPDPAGAAASSQVAEPHYRAVLLGPDVTFGNGLDVPAVKLVTSSDDADCVIPDLASLQSVCFNDWSFSFETVEEASDVVNSVDASLRASASLLGIGTASGTLSWEDYYRSRSDSVHALLTAEMRRCKYDVTASMKPDREAAFGSDYAAFRAVCGDRFLSAQTTGGSFVAVFEKELAQDEDLKDFRLRLKAKVAGLTVFDHTWKDSADRELADFGLNVRVVTDRSHVSAPWLSLADATGQFEDFANRVHSDLCANEEGYLNCVYRSSFNLYDVTTATPRDRSANLDLLEQNLYSLEGYAGDYERLRALVDAILARPDEYDIGSGADRFSKPNDWSLESLGAFADTLTADIGTLRAAAASCRAQLSGCTESASELGFKGWFELADALPPRKLHVPKDCLELSLYYGARTDGSYSVYFDRDITKSYDVTCAGMGTSTPRTYLPLVNTSAALDQPTGNYSTYAGADGAAGRTLFTALLLSDDTSGAEYTLYGSLPPGDGFTRSDVPSPAAETLGLAGAYNCSGAPVSSNLDLSGTPFVLSDSAGSAVDSSADASRVSWKVTDRARLDLHLAGGACAYLRPSALSGRVSLLYAGRSAARSLGPRRALETRGPGSRSEEGSAAKEGGPARHEERAPGR